MKNHRNIVILIAAGALAIAAGAAWATIPDSNGVVHACYAKSNGTLRVIDLAVASCKQQEAPLDWNQTGPPGADGAPGPSDGYYSALLGAHPLSSSDPPRTLTTLDLPAGDYLVYATARFSDATATLGGFCSIDDPNVGGTDAVGSFEIVTGTGGASVALSLKTSGPVSLPLVCSVFGASGPATVSTDDAKVTAIKVGTLHAQ